MEDIVELTKLGIVSIKEPDTIHKLYFTLVETKELYLQLGALLFCYRDLI